MSQEFYVKVTGKKQNLFKGESKKDKRSDWHEGLSLAMGSMVAVDPNSGGPRGYRQHDALKITKERGGASPMLLQSHWKNETLSEVVIEIVGRAEDGNEEIVLERITLKEAWVSEFKRYSANNAKDTVQTDVHHLEDYGLRFKHIMVEDLVAGTSTEDDWTKPNG
jgi:type VI secretion system Hcp family effector